MNPEERFLARLARGSPVTQDDYDQMVQFISPEILAGALVRRYNFTEDMRTILEAVQLYILAERPYQALEVCSRFPKDYSLRKFINPILTQLRAVYYADYPATWLVGKLLEEAFLVINLRTGAVTRFPPIMPSTLSNAAPAEKEYS